MSRGVELLVRALDVLEAEAPSDGATLVEVQRQLDRLGAIQSRAAASFDASKAWLADGARSAGGWIASKCGVPKPAADRLVRMGRAVRTMPVTEAAWLAGEVSVDHVRVLAEAKDLEGFREEEADLVEVASSTRWRRFLQELAYWRQLHDEDRDEDRAAKQVEERKLHLSQSFEGRWFLDGVGDPIGGSVVAETLRLIEQDLFELDWREARERLGREPVAVELRRAPAQRRWDALVEMATRARTAPADGRRPEPLFTVVVDFETFAGRVCQLANGTVVTPGSLVPHLDRAWAERIVFGPRSRVLDVGVTTRCFTGADRRAVQVKDLGECFHELCDECGDHLQIDHVEPYAAGGATIQDNGRVACATHNRGRNRRSRGSRPPRGP